MSDIAELFARDPLKLTDDDISKVVEVYRERRVNFKEAEAKPKKAKAPATPKLKSDTAAIVDGLNLEDLFK